MLALLLFHGLTGCFVLDAGEDEVDSADLVVFADVGVVVREGRIASVHERAADAQEFVGPNTLVLRAPRVTPGFVDAHLHPASYGRTLTELDVTGAASYAETLDRVAAAAPGDGWLRGRGWDQNDWADAPDGGWPRAADLDGLTGDRPVALRRVDGHANWLNSAALKAAGIDASTADPEGGRIVRDSNGNPTGVLIDKASLLLPKPEPTKVEIRRWVVDGVTRLAQTGLTGVHVMGVDDPTLEVLEYLDRNGTMPLRLWVYVMPDTHAAARLQSEGPWGGRHVKVMGVKVYADGALGSRGALLSARYADEPAQHGLSLTEPEVMATLATSLTAMGAQVAIHAIGDLGVRRALDAVATAREANPGADVRHRVEHAQVVHPDDLARFAELSVVASVQPTHATSDMPWAGARLGEERLAWSYAWRSLADAGAVLAFGSDAPVEAPDPAAGLWAATTRTTSSGEPPGGWRISESVSEAEAVAAFTAGAAWAVGEEADLGALEPGQLADLTLWSVSAERWAPVATVVGGQAIWRDARALTPSIEVPGE